MGLPGAVCKLQKGALIDTQEGFVDTFNWLVDFVCNLRGESPIDVDKTDTSRPVIKFDDSEDPDDSDETEEISVVTGLRYDAESHKLIATMKKVTIVKADESTGSTEFDMDVFTAEPMEVPD